MGSLIFTKGLPILHKSIQTDQRFVLTIKQHMQIILIVLYLIYVNNLKIYIWVPQVRFFQRVLYVTKQPKPFIIYIYLYLLTQVANWAPQVSLPQHFGIGVPIYGIPKFLGHFLIPQQPDHTTFYSKLQSSVRCIDGSRWEPIESSEAKISANEISLLRGSDRAKLTLGAQGKNSCRNVTLSIIFANSYLNFSIQ